MSLIVDAAIGGPYEEMRRLIVSAGIEDSSGFRRAVLSHIAKSNHARVAEMLRCSVSDAENLQDVFVKAWGPIPEDCK